MEETEQFLQYSLFVKIKEMFINKIEIGEWNSGDNIPSPIELSSRLNISIEIINKVVNSLVFDGYVKNHPNKGLYIGDNKINQNINSSIALSDSMIEHDLYERDKLLSFKRMLLPRNIGWKTRIEDDSEVIYIELIKYLDRKCFCLERVYIPIKNCKGLSKELIEQFGLTNSLNKLGFIADSNYKTFEALNISKEDAIKMNVVKDKAVILFAKESFMFKNSILYSESIILGDKFRFFCELENKEIYMDKSQILLTRIDNRLVHGQVGVTWTKTIGANLIIVADDIVVKDELQQSLMSVTAKSSGVGIRFFSIQHTADIISKASPRQKIFIVVRTPKDARRLVELGVSLEKLNVGNMHFSQGKVALTKKVYVDDNDLNDLKFIAKSGVEVYCQDVPGEAIEVIK